MDVNNKEVAFGFELQEPKVLLTTVLYSVYATVHTFTPLTDEIFLKNTSLVAKRSFFTKAN